MKRTEIKAITPDSIYDFIKMYRVFRNAPYYEDWTDEKIIDEYNDLWIDKNVYGYYEDDVCIGLITFRNKRPEDEFRHPVCYPGEKVAYLADLTVLSEYRGRGIGTTLMKYALQVLKMQGYDRAYMKTLQVGKSMSYGIAIKLGFKLLDGVTSIDKMHRICKEKDEEDLKIYLDKKL